MSINDGGPAFPEAVAIGPSGDVYPGMGGMSLRDWFAGQAAAAIIGGICAQGRSTDSERAPLVARSAYLLADAMLAARGKEPSA